MLTQSRINSVQYQQSEPDAAQESPNDHPTITILEPPETSQLPGFSSQNSILTQRQSFVYVSHAILIVAALGMVNWLHSTSPVSLHLGFEFSEQLIDWQVAQD